VVSVIHISHKTHPNLRTDCRFPRVVGSAPDDLRDALREVGGDIGDGPGGATHRFE